MGPHRSRQVPADHPPRPAGWLGRASPAGWLGRASPAGCPGQDWPAGRIGQARPAGCPRWEGQPAACREGRRGSRRRPLTGPPADHGVMTPSRAGETVSCYRPACGGTRAPGCGGRGPGPGPCSVDIGRGSGMVLRTVQHLASRQGELAARARLCQGPLDRPRCQAQRARADPVACWAGGWKREGPGCPVDNGERARCRRDGLRSEGMPGPSSLPALERAPGRPGAQPATA